MQGQAPEGYEFIDEEEEYVLAANGRSGSWQPYQPKPSQAEQPISPPQKKPAKRKPKKKSEVLEPAAQDGSMEEI